MTNSEKQRKRIICLLLAASMLGTAGCGAGGTAESAPAAASVPSVTAEAQPEETAEAETEAAQPEETAEAETEAAQPEETAEQEAQPEEAATPAGLTGYTLTETGTFEVPGSAELISDYGKLMTEDGGIYHMLSLTGAENNTTDYLDERDTGIDGYVMVTTADAINADDVNCWGLVDPDGEEILPCEAAAIEQLGTSTRFVVVYYATEETTEDDSEAIMHLYSMYDENGVFRLGLENEEGDEYYKGYRRIFDLQTKTFFNDLKITSTEYSPYDATDALVQVSGTLYSADGTELAKGSNIQITGEVASFSSGNTYYIYDANGERFSSEDELKAKGEGVAQRTDDGWILLDCDGNQLSDTVFKTIYEYHAGVAYVTDAVNSAYQLIKIASGEVLYEYNGFMYYIADGYWYSLDSGITVIDSEGVVSTGNDYLTGGTDLCVTDGQRKYLNLSTGESVEFEIGSHALTYALLAAKNANGKYAVYDLFTGNALTGYSYDDIVYAHGYVYAVEGTTCHVFKVSKEQ